MIRPQACLVVVLVALTGCAVGPNYRAPVVKVPTTFAQTSAENGGDTAALADWWKTFGDETLNSLIERAIKNNVDVNIAVARLREARASLRYTRASTQLPTRNINGTYSRSRTSTENPQIPKLGAGTSLIPTTDATYQSYLDASYEVDLFGGVRRQVEASKATAQSYEENLRSTLISSIAEVARDYFQLRQYQEQLAVAQRTEVSRQDTLKITQVRNKAGLASDLDVANAEASLASISPHTGRSKIQGNRPQPWKPS